MISKSIILKISFFLILEMWQYLIAYFASSNDVKVTKEHHP